MPRKRYITEPGLDFLALVTNSLTADHGAAPRCSIVIFAGLADWPLRAVRIDPLTAILPADDLRVRIDRDQRQGANCDRRRDQILRIFHSLFLHPCIIPGQLPGDKQRHEIQAPRQ
jgi:hypothetical protein